MRAKWVCGALVGAFCVTAGVAHAGCGDRPGTPNNVIMTATSPNSVEVAWRNTTQKGLNPSGSASADATHKMWFDMYFRNGSTGSIGRDLTGTGPYDVNYGMITRRTFDGLTPNTRYCFALRARDGAGTSGCVSAVTSNWACATTLAAGQKPPPPSSTAPSGGPAQPVLGIQGQPDNTLVLNGRGFLSNASVSIRVVNRQLNQIWITTIGGAPIKTSSTGWLSVTLKGLCKTQGDTLTFTVTDGRPNLFSKPVSANCS